MTTFDQVTPARPDGEVAVTSDTAQSLVSRRNVLRFGAAGAAAFGLGTGSLALEPSLARRGLLSRNGVFGAASIAFSDAIYTEAFPTSPLILSPFSDPLPIPPALKPVP